MAIGFRQVITPSDWVKIAVLLVVALIAWYQVYALYSQPFDFTDEIKRQTQENLLLPPLAPPTP